MLESIESINENILNCFFQFIIASCAVIAICVTFSQISSKTKINLKMKMDFKLNKIESNETIVQLEIKMVNMGMAPVYISTCGIHFWRNRKEKKSIKIADITECLKPGQSKVVASEYHADLIDDSAMLHDKVYMYAICQLDKMYYYKKDVILYNEFIYKYWKYKKRADKDNGKKLLHKN